MTKPQRISLSYYGYSETPTGRVLTYLLKNPLFSSREGKSQAVDAITAYWKPFAERHHGQLDDVALKTVAWQSIQALKRQIYYIAESFDLPDLLVEQSRVLQVLSNQLQQPPVLSQGSPPLAPSLAQLPAKKTPASTLTSLDAEAVDFDEDAILGSLSNNY